MKNTTANPLHNRQCKDTKSISQFKQFFKYLQNHTATASMITAAIGLPQKNICRYKRMLEKAGRLWQVKKKPCKKTGRKAWYLTTDPESAPSNNQLKLF